MISSVLQGSCKASWGGGKVSLRKVAAVAVAVQVIEPDLVVTRAGIAKVVAR